MPKYNHKKIEHKWQKVWETKRLYRARDFDKKRKKFYTLVEFPYPSGDGLHVGHARSYSALDAVARFKRMNGRNVLYPMGFDAFGLPTENYAIKNKIAPQVATSQNVKNFTRQLKSLGLSFDWDRQVNTTDPKYYKWTQWIFLKLYEAGMAYRTEIPINWCPKCKTGLANEEVISGRHERCGTPVEKKLLKQWLIRITKYADRLLSDLKLVDYPERVKTQQINWIGKSEGSEIEFRISSRPSLALPIKGREVKREIPLPGREGLGEGGKIKVFTTRPDTIFGATYLVVAPEHELIKNQESRIKNYVEVKRYVEAAMKKTDIARTTEEKEKTGVELKGIKAINPATKEEVPVWVADYVLTGYGTGAIMAVPAHDDRDFSFAKKYNLPIRQVIAPYIVDHIDKPKEGVKTEPRNALQCIIYNPKTDEVLGMQWNVHKLWRTFITGGIEEGEDIVAAARREVLEETGYKNLKLVKVLGTEVHELFYHLVKQVNRYAKFRCVVFELENEEKDPVDLKEAKQHVPVWIKKDSMKDFLTAKTFKDYLDIWLSGERAFVGEGMMINSGEFNGQKSEVAREKITEKFGKSKVSYKLRDWIFSRQHYWGEPIPLVFCPECKKQVEIFKSQFPISKQTPNSKFSKGEIENPGWVSVPEKDLPVELPNVKSYEPSDTGKSPLAAIKSFVRAKCPRCGGPARRETDTMPNWAGSNWYYLAYLMRGISNFQFPISKYKKVFNYWMPIDLYNGGMEHTTLHLLYSRFIHKFLYDQGFVPGPEPYAKRTSHGIILAEDGRKMSKSFGNVVNPDEIVAEHGADTLRMYEMFLAPFEQMVPWDSRGVIGVKRFLDRVFSAFSAFGEGGLELVERPDEAGDSGIQKKLIHKLIKKVTDDLEAMKFNTAVSAFMEALNKLESLPGISKETAETYLLLLAPFAPHLAEEIWHQLGHKDSIHGQSWPKPDKKYLVEDTLKIPVAINGKVRDTIIVPADTPQNEIENQALNSPRVEAHLKGKTIVRTIYVSGKMINFVVK